MVKMLVKYFYNRYYHSIIISIIKLQASLGFFRIGTVRNTKFCVDVKLLHLEFNFFVGLLVQGAINNKVTAIYLSALTAPNELFGLKCRT